MKSKIKDNYYYLECGCHMPHHLLCFDFDLEDYSIGMSFVSNWKAPWYKRIWYAIMFVVNKEKFCWNDEVIINSEDITELEEVIEKIKERCND